MSEAEATPKWMQQEVLPRVQGRVRSVHVVTPKSALVFTDDHVALAEKATLSGVKLYRVDYPPGFFLNASLCPHCGQQLREPIAKVARLADGASTGKGSAKGAGKPARKKR